MSMCPHRQLKSASSGINLLLVRAFEFRLTPLQALHDTSIMAKSIGCSWFIHGMEVVYISENLSLEVTLQYFILTACLINNFRDGIFTNVSATRGFFLL